MRDKFARRFQYLRFALLTLGMVGTAMAQSITLNAPANATISPGVAAESTIVFSVGGAIPGTTVTVTKASGYLYSSGSATAGWTCIGSAGPLSCSGGTTTNFNFSLIAPLESSFTSPLTAPDASGLVTVDNQTAGSASVTTFYTVRSDIVIQSPTVSPLAVGETVALNFNVINGGPGAPFYRFRQTRVLFTLPNDLVYAGSNTAPWSCTAAGANVTCLLDEASTPSPASRPIPLTVRRSSAPAGASQISYSVGTPNNDPNPSNNQGSIAVPLGVVPTVDLRLVGTNPGPQDSGTAFTTRFTLDAVQGSAAANTEVRFSQPSSSTQQIQGISSSSSQFSCSVDAGGLGGNCVASVYGTLGVTATPPPVEFIVTGVAPVVATSQSDSIVLRGIVSSSTTDTNPGNNAADVNITVLGPAPVAAQLQISKSASASLVGAGQEYSYSLTTSNVGSVAANGLILEDQLASNLSFIAIEQASVGLFCNQDAGLVRCTQTQLSAGAQASVGIRVRAPMAPGTIFNTATVTSANASAPQSASATVQVDAGVDLVLEKTDSVDPVNAGGEFEYLLNVSNRGTSIARSLSLNDDLPSSTSFVSVSGGGFSCNSGQNLRCTMDSLAAGGTAIVRVRVRALSAGQALNTASVSTPDTEVTLANNSDSEATTIAAPASVETDLALTAPGNQNATVGGDTSVIYTVRNLGPANSSCGTLNLSLSGGVAPAFTLKSVAGLGANCTVSGSTATCQLPPINALAQAQISATLGAIGAASSTLSATLTCTTDTNPSNNAATTILTGMLSPGADLKLTVRDDDPVVLQSEYNYVVSADNFGPEEARAVSIKFTLPEGTDFVSFTGANFSCLAQAQVITCPYSANLSALATQRTARLTVRVRARAEVGQVTTVVEVNSASRDPNPADNTVRETTQINAKDGEQVAGVILPQLTDQFALDAAPVVADICARPVPELVAQCEAIIDAALDRDIGALQTGLRAIFPEEVLSERLALVQQSATQFSNIDSRLSELQNGGGAGLSLGGLNLAFGKTLIPLGMLQPLLDGDDEAEVGGSGDLISPWGFFVNGTYSRGDQTLDRTLRTVSSDFRNIGVTAGVDYRLSIRTVLGAALGYSKFDTDLSDDGRTSSKAITLTGYGSHYFNDNLYADARITVGNASFDSVRRIRFSYQNFSIDKTALGSNDARQYALAAGIGYNLQKGAWSITPNANVRYFRSNVDGYTETGAGANNVIFDDQQVSSLQYNLGVQVSRPISLSHGVLAPQFDLSFGHETQDANFALNARLVDATATQVFTVRAQDPDKSFGNIGLGFVYVTSNGRQGYLTYRRLFGNDSTQRDSINLGARFDF
jgi:uncharacterized repeat protein (TIGR01451 family)